MPSSPVSLCRDCTSRAISNGYCAAHQQDNSAAMHKRLYDRQRADDPIRALYRTKRWRRTRRIVLARDVLCRACGHKAGTDVDHIVSARVIVEQFGMDEFFNESRCQLLCHGCHAKKTATESGWAGSRSVATATSASDALFTC